MSAESLVVGIFVGGRGTRLGGVDKGRLRAPGTELTLVERLAREVRLALGDVELVLVGDARGGAHAGILAISDEPGGVGPLGGLGGLLGHARAVAAPRALALSCDLPYLEAALLRRLAREAPGVAALVTHQGGFRNPLVARYDVARTSPAVARVLSIGKSSLQAVLDELGDGVQLLPLSKEEQSTLRDWDTPEDVRR
jgi:molybdenum cofactor guanylyltransferase